MKLVPAIVKHAQLSRTRKTGDKQIVLHCVTADNEVYHPSYCFAKTPCSTGPNKGTPIKTVSTRTLAAAIECEADFASVVRGRNALLGKSVDLKLELDTPPNDPETGLPTREPVLRAEACYFEGTGPASIDEDDFING